VGDGLLTLFLCGDVMTGRGVDQVLPYPGDPELRERYAGDARAYVRLAERANHWGSNWGYGVGPDQVRFARRLIDGGVDLIHGHSSHHPGPVEVFGGKLVLYGCGDCINDYEGITGHERYRGDLRLLYFASLHPGTGALAALRMAPLQARNLRLHRAPQADARWLATAVERASSRFGSLVGLRPDGLLALRSGPS